MGANILQGARQGAITGGLDAALNGTDIGKGLLYGAGSGAAFGFLSSQHFKNSMKGQGFRNNDAVLSSFVADGNYQGALDYFGFEGTPAKPSEFKLGEAVYDGKYSHLENKVFLNKDVAFSSYDRLSYISNKENWHLQRKLSGNFFYDNAKDGGISFKAEDALGHAFAKRNAGLYPSINPDTYPRGFSLFMSRASQSARSSDLWPLLKIHSKVYSIPRRFNFILPF